MFKSYVGVGSGYKALGESFTPATSPDTIPSWTVARSLKAYNQLVAEAYFQGYFPDNKPLVQPSLKDLIEAHLESDEELLGQSPFASSSVERVQAEEWAKSKMIQGAKTVVLFTANVPVDGGILAFGQKYGIETASDLPGLKGVWFSHPHEEEFMVPGGLSPASIKEIKVFQLGHERRGFYAKREDSEEGVFVGILDVTSQKNSRRYKLNSQTGD